MSEKAKGAKKLWERYKYALAVALIGAALLLWPGSRSGGTDTAPPRTQEAVQIASDDDLTERMEEALATISGVGQVKVLLTVDSDGERQLAQNTELAYSGSTAAPEDYSRRSETVLVDGTEGDGTVVVRTVYPTYRGALVVCQGGDRPEVKLAVTEAVAALTGLSADRVTVAKWQ